MSGYTRQSTADIIPTAVVRAAPINAEFRTEFRAFDGTPVIIWNCYLPGATFVES